MPIPFKVLRKILPKKPRKVTERDFDNFLQWYDQGTTSHKTSHLAKSIERIAHATGHKPPKKGIVYRGFVMSKKEYDRMRKGKKIKLQPRAATSWTTDLEKAAEYSDGSSFVPNSRKLGRKPIGVILRAPIKNNALASLDNDLLKKFNKRAKKYWSDTTPNNQKEIVMRGNGIPHISKEYVAKIYDPRFETFKNREIERVFKKKKLNAYDRSLLTKKWQP
jgi:hypothetical protein